MKSIKSLLFVILFAAVPSASACDLWVGLDEHGKLVVNLSGEPYECGSDIDEKEHIASVCKDSLATEIAENKSSLNRSKFVNACKEWLKQYQKASKKNTAE
ncbi:hypothetical protein [Aliikangiella sp. G2MR2-5]|uniref:hypothetical protein n=1 Tax=Aliikangiella sp. G2MR2-5 TaxID=2788943 RepID=UPI0018ABAD88|nr:hypothetical protein [Aliikangiella sp. G2MR2-5]